MKESELKYSQYKFKFKSPLRISNHILSEKDTILLKYKYDNGNIYYGEVSPLFGFSAETIEQCKESLQDSEKISVLIKKNKRNALHELYSSIPSLLFGLEQVMFSKEVQNNRKSFQNKLIKINALIGIKNEENTLEEVKKFVNSGFKTIKLKIGRSEFTDDLSILNKIDQIYGSEVNLRLDNNSAWKINQAKRNIERLLRFNIEYLEQPVENLDDLINLAEFSDVQIAPDESIKDYSIGKQLIEEGQFKFLVIKPSIRIGIYDSIKLINLSNKKDVKIIISSAFETAIGRSSLLHLASLNKHNYAHGLNTELLGIETIKPGVNYGSPEILIRPSKIKNYSLKQL